MHRPLKQNIPSRFSILAAMIVFFAIPAFASGASAIVSPGNGFGARDLLSDEWIDGFCLFGDGVAVFSMENGLEIIDRANPASGQSWGRPQDYFAAHTDPSSGYVNVWNSFMTPDPSGDSLWIGFTMWDNTDDRIYRVDAGGTWDAYTTLSGNFDLEFFGGEAYVSANPGGLTQAQSTIYRLDTTWADQHAVVAEVGGYSAGLGFDAAGNLYYGTCHLDEYYAPIDNKMIRYSASDVALGDLTIDDAEILFDLTSGGCDVDVDDAGNVVFNVNDFAGGNFVGVWNEAVNGGEPRQAAVPGGAGWPWFSLLEVSGNVAAGGSIYVADSDNAPGIAQIVKLAPGDANGDFCVDEADAAILAGRWGNSDVLWADGDFDGDGKVGPTDAAILAANWSSGPQPAEAASAPEPIGVVLLATLLFALVGTRFGKK
ncbi:MAG TPA: hypothetical protein DD670_03815 [Planctomycetaceae bacterium]|nr:hypothetical protein [Planctomycetaceae bacterium]